MKIILAFYNKLFPIICFAGMFLSFYVFFSIIGNSCIFSLTGNNHKYIDAKVKAIPKQSGKYFYYELFYSYSVGGKVYENEIEAKLKTKAIPKRIKIEYVSIFPSVHRVKDSTINEITIASP